MDSLLFPTAIVDNFLSQPEKYIQLANSLEYEADVIGKWPGVRSKNLNEIYPEMINKIITKIVSLYYNFNYEQVSWSSYSYFQKIKSSFDSGWVHSDSDQLTCIIYLCGEGLGTSLCVPKDVSTFCSPINSDKKWESYKNPNDIIQFKEFKEENNKQFQKNISIDSRFNRLLAFESSLYHCADNFKLKNKDEERLTLIIFIDNINSNKFPIQRCKRD